jgi:hypothetical protein
MATSVLRIDVCSRLLAQNLSLDARALDRASEFAVELLNKERAKNEVYEFDPTVLLCSNTAIANDVANMLVD